MLTEQAKKVLKQKIQSNQHQMFIVSLDEMDAIVRLSKTSKKDRVTQAWNKFKSKAEVGANYTASASDVVTLSKLIGDLGGIGAKAYVKTYGGRPHIIIKGRPGLRRVLTGTKYGIKNPKVIAMGLGKAGAISAARMGGIISVVLLTVFRVIEYFLTDQSTLTKLVGHLAMDIVKVGITTGASIAIATGVAAITTVAIGPILAVLVVGLAVTTALNMIDKRYGITELIIAGLDELTEKTISSISEVKHDVQMVKNNIVDSIIDHTIESARRIVINFASYHLRKFTSNIPIFY